MTALPPSRGVVEERVDVEPLDAAGVPDASAAVG